VKKIYFVTSNKRKVIDYNRRLALLGYKVLQLNNDLNEGRSLDIEEIAKLKLGQAREVSSGRPVFVEDRGFFIPAFQGFPGPFVKLFLKSIGISGLMKLMQDIEDRRAQFISVLAYWDGKQEHYFYDNEEGFLTKNIRSGDIRGWTDILYIYGYKTHPKKALCELNDTEWNEYLKEIEKNDYIKKFCDFLSKNS